MIKNKEDYLFLTNYLPEQQGCRRDRPKLYGCNMNKTNKEISCPKKFRKNI